MSIRLSVEHRTAYRYDRPVRLGPHAIRLRPAPHCRTPIVSYSLRVDPAQHFVNWQQDPFGNFVARFVFPEPARALRVTVDLVADMTVINPFDFFVDEEARTWPFVYEPSLALDLAPYLARGGNGTGPLLDAWLGEVPRTEAPIADFLVGLNRRVLGDVAYTVRMEQGVQTPEHTLERAVGSCRDSAWLLVAILRRLGIAARFASGYLVQLAEDDPPADATEQHDFTDLHAWAEAYVPGAGWIGLDPTSGLLAGEGHIPLACTPSPGSAAPITGSVEAADTILEFSNVVRRIHEPPRVTLPYTEAQWRRIDALGRAVDVLLEAGDARLTMGGEPTFVAANARDAPEWNTLAVGGRKRQLAVALAGRLEGAFAPGALTLHGQGKWYPGEVLPRWQVGVCWLADGQPLWPNSGLLADPTVRGTCGFDDARRLMTAIADGLGLPADARYPAYEDPLERLWRESRLPAGEAPEPPGPDPTDPSIADRDARVAVVAGLDSERGEPLGWAMPLHREPGDDEWSTGHWHLRRGHLFLVPGDSPIGLRLPLDSLTWTPPPMTGEQSLFRAVSELGEGADPAPMTIVEPPPVTAVCVELRGGHVHVFLPPLQELEHAIELIGLVASAAAATGVAIVVEGYPPPRDPRLRQFVVAPDPGVIEVNIHPSGSWPELAERTLTLWHEAHAVGLATEKFSLDGAHAGTGGGGHLTLGGTTPRDSPLVRRPDLMRSLLTFWQHHPSLSYLFAGRFVGPTSQAPRIDEGRHENLYELEIAFSELERLGRLGSPPPWQLDRLLRHLLVDVTGNTHRAEFCIDKLFSPESEHGRLGVVELRGFEMPPHPQMALVQALLVRALVARFWTEPYTGPLVRWGTELHDRFLLPWWARADIAAVVSDLDQHGIGFEMAWLEPFLEFRFPLIGTFTVDDVTLELRSAIEPWHVLGEEIGATTARYVDSSTERLQIHVDGLTEPRYAVTCNGFPVPVQPTETPGTYVGGVRYRAWQPWSALHPTIGVHTPLTFDVVDRWSERSLGGCRYHVSHPGGRAYERFPVNAAEAQARRASRFETIGHTPGAVRLPEIRRRILSDSGPPPPRMTSTAPPPSSAYQPLPGGYDEMVDETGAPRPHWEYLARALDELGTEELLRRQQEASRLLDQDGVMYNAQRESGRPRRRWMLDPVPTIVPSREWAVIETGVIERAELLNLILEDLYGDRDLLRRGLLPPAVVFGHAGFLRPCDGIRLPGAQQLFTYAADIGRDDYGRPVVISDRAQAPSGSGYALENRTVVSRVLPSLYRGSQVHRLAPFFRSLRAGLQEAAPPGIDDPRIVVLTPGPYNETAFEHALLASSLGYPLVEGRDLTVRGGRVWMRSVGQLEPVDVILRRVDSWYCDPLELKPDSQLGVPGVLEATRAGAVSVVNTIGSSVLENPALMAFLPRVSEHLIGGPLRLASLPTWWCGEDEGRRHVLANLERLILRPTSPGPWPASIRGWELSDERLAELREAISARPVQWVGQEPPAMSSAPILTPSGLKPRRGVLRAFAIARTDSYVVMPGGLMRVAPIGDHALISMQAGAITKDTWVLASEPEPLTGFWLQPGMAVPGIDPMSSMPSRAAESLWWLGRYAERAEALTRLLRTVHDRRNEFQGSANPAGVAALRALLVALTTVSSTHPGFAGSAEALDAPGAELLDLVINAARPGTVAHAVRAVLDNAYAVRDQLSRDTWLVVGPLERAISDLGDPVTDPQAQTQTALQEVMRSLLALGGLGVEGMVRDVGWRFMDAGRRLERGMQLLSLLRATVVDARGTATDSLVLESVLGSAESIITYRFRYRSHAQLETVLDLLLLDRGNPRSMAYQLERLTENLDVVPPQSELRLREDQRLVLEASTALRLADPASLVSGSQDGRRRELDAFLGRLLELLQATGDAVDRAHFEHVAPTFALIGPAGAEPSIGRAA